MNEIQQWALSLCGAAIVCGILHCIMPERLGGKTILSLFFLCVLVTPIERSPNILPEFSMQDQEELTAELEAESLQLAYSIAEEHILELIQRTLAENEFMLDSLELMIEGQGESAELKVTLCLPDSQKNREEELCQLLKNYCGIENPEIKWQEEQ